MKKTLKRTSVTLVASSLVTQAILPATGVVGVALVAATVSSKAHASSKVDVGQSILEINANKPIASTNMFHMQNSNTIVLDVIGVDRTFDNVVVENDPLIEKVVTRIVGDKARVVITTKQPVKYGVEVAGTTIIAKFAPSEAFESLTPSQPAVAPAVVAEAVKNGNEWKEETKRAISQEELNKLVSQMREDTNKTAAQNGVTVTPLKVTETAPQNELNIHELRKINLKKENSKVTKIVFDLSTSDVSPEVQKTGDRLLINLPGVSIPSELQRRVSTESLGTAVKVLDVTTQKNSGRIALEVANNWEYSFYQADKQFAIVVKTIDENAETKKYTGKPLTISFQDIEVRALLQVIADFTNLNIMTSDNVQGSMTLRLKDVPWDQALDLILDARGLQKVKEGNVIRIATNEEVEKSNESKLKLKDQGAALEKLKLEFFPINYYKAEDLKAVLEGAGGKDGGSGSSKEGGGGKNVSLLSNRGSIGVDVRNNILMVQDTEDSLQYVRSIIKKLDVPVRQVLIEAKIVIAEDSFGRELGSRFGIRGFNQKSNSSQGIGGNIVESGNVAGGSLDPVTPVTNLAAAALNGFSAGSIGFTLLNVSGNALGLELSALENKNKGKVLSSPRLLTTDNTKAVIEQGSEIPYITPGSGDSPPTVSFKKAVLKLDVTPQITPNGRVIMDLEIRKDTIGQLVNVQGGGQVPSIDTRSINNKISVTNGQTVVLGGIYEISNRDDVTKIPFFGDIPLIGNFFKHKGKGEDKGELMIFITPHIIEDEDLDDAAPVEINLSAKK